MSEEQIYQVLRQLAEQFGTTVDHLWAIMVRQAYIEAGTLLFTYLVFFISTIFMIRRSKAIYRYGNDNSEDDYIVTASWLKLIIGWTISISSFLIFVGTFDQFITALFNPDYWVLQQIFNLLGG